MENHRDKKVKDETCIFCKLANGEIPTRSIYEDKQFKVIMDMNPLSKGHCLILPKEHYKNLYDIPEQVLADAITLAKKMAITMTEKLGATGFNIVQNNNESAGQTVFHFHIHLVPRYDEDGEPISWTPTSPSSEELDQVYALLKEE